MDYSYLDSLAGEVYGLIYYRLIHKWDRKEKRKEITEQLSRLRDDEKAYIRQWVTEAFELLRTKDKKKK